MGLNDFFLYKVPIKTEFMENIPFYSLRYVEHFLKILALFEKGDSYRMNNHFFNQMIVQNSEKEVLLDGKKLIIPTGQISFFNNCYSNLFKEVFKSLIKPEKDLNFSKLLEAMIEHKKFFEEENNVHIYGSFIKTDYPDTAFDTSFDPFRFVLDLKNIANFQERDYGKLENKQLSFTPHAPIGNLLSLAHFLSKKGGSSRLIKIGKPTDDPERDRRRYLGEGKYNDLKNYDLVTLIKADFRSEHAKNQNHQFAFDNSKNYYDFSEVYKSPSCKVKKLKGFMQREQVISYNVTLTLDPEFGMDNFLVTNAKAEVYFNLAGSAWEPYINSLEDSEDAASSKEENTLSEFNSAQINTIAEVVKKDICSEKSYDVVVESSLLKFSYALFDHKLFSFNQEELGSLKQGITCFESKIESILKGMINLQQQKGEISEKDFNYKLISSYFK